jgi:GTP-binding protein
MKELFLAAHFLQSAFYLKDLPEDFGREVAFIGRSNAGKSSVINALTQQKNLCKVSKTPGRTQLINFFALGQPEAKLVDLPGYGFAKVPQKFLQHWQNVLPAFLAQRRALQGLVLVMDVRHPLQANDRQMLDWCAHSQVPVYALLTKADKLSKSQQQSAWETFLQAQPNYPSLIGGQLFSAHSGQGVAELRQFLAVWLQLATASLEKIECAAP